MITSHQNQKIKEIIKLNKSKERKLKGIVIVEGKREFEICLKGGHEVIEVIYCTKFGKIAEQEIKQFRKLEVDKKVFEKISNRENPDGILAIVKINNLSLDKYRLKSKNPLVLVLDGVEKPGNLGAILRSCDGAGVDLLIVNNKTTDIYSPNTIRASQGTVFSQVIVKDSNENILKWLKLNKIKLYSATPHTQKYYYKESYINGSAFLLGSEDKGLSDFWMKNCDSLVKLPMLGKIDSLNVSVTAGILIYEALRQRRV